MKSKKKAAPKVWRPGRSESPNVDLKVFEPGASEPKTVALNNYLATREAEGRRLEKIDTEAALPSLPSAPGVFDVTMNEEGRSGHTRVGKSTIIAAGFSREVMTTMAANELNRQLAQAEKAYARGDDEGLRQALELLSAHRKHQPMAAWPDWVQGAMTSEAGDSKKKKKVGRPHVYALDYVRGMLVTSALEPGVSLYRAYQVVGQNFDIAVNDSSQSKTPKVLQAAYERFCDRVLFDSSSMYPFLQHPTKRLAVIERIPERIVLKLKAARAKIGQPTEFIS